MKIAETVTSKTLRIVVTIIAIATATVIADIAETEIFVAVASTLLGSGGTIWLASSSFFLVSVITSSMTTEGEGWVAALGFIINVRRHDVGEIEILLCWFNDVVSWSLEGRCDSETIIEK